MPNSIYETDYTDFYDPVRCLGDLGEKWCNFKWRIYNLHLNPKTTFQSPIFTTRLLPETHWFVEVKVLYRLSFVRGLEISLRRLRDHKDSVSVVEVIYKCTCGENESLSDKRTYVYKNEALQDDRYRFPVPIRETKAGHVTIECKLRPNKVMIRGLDHGKYDATLPVDLRKLLQSSEAYDTVVKVDDQEFFAHYAILCARLPKLVCPLNKKGEKNYIVEVKDLPASVVKEMLKYAYTGQAYVDLGSVSSYKDVLSEHYNFYHNCCWDDSPIAMSFFNYETDSLLWNLKGCYRQNYLGHQRIYLLRLNPSELEFSLKFLEYPDGETYLALEYKYCSDKIPKPTMFSCTYYLFDDITEEEFDLGQTEILLHANKTAGLVKMGSLAAIKAGQLTLKVDENYFFLKTDFKFCYGSSKSSIENLYDGQFDISKCTGCAILNADMHRLSRGVEFKDVNFVGKDACEIRAHKAIVLARWEDAEKYQVKEQETIVMEDHDYDSLKKLCDHLYTGNAFD